MICKVRTCDRPRLARGWCNTHYRRWKKYGNPHRVAGPKTHCVNGHPFNKQNTYVRPSGKRDCRECQRFFGRQRVRRHKPPTIWNEWRKQYQREVRAGLRTPKPRKRKPVHSQVQDLLMIEGGWWTTAAVALRLNCPTDTAGQAMYRLERKGLLESRRVQLASGPNRAGIDSRKEWRANGET